MINPILLLERIEKHQMNRLEPGIKLIKGGDET